MRTNNFFLSTGAEATGGKLDQADALARLAQFDTALAEVKLSLPDLISQHASLAADKQNLTTQIAELKGDSTKLVAGATLSTDLVTAANELAAVKKENETLKAEKKTVDEAAAKKVASLGIVEGAKPAEAAGGKKPTLTEQVIAAKGAKDLTELNAKHTATVTANAAV